MHGILVTYIFSYHILLMFFYFDNITVFLFLNLYLIDRGESGLPRYTHTIIFGETNFFFLKKFKIIFI